MHELPSKSYLVSLLYIADFLQSRGVIRGERLAAYGFVPFVVNKYLMGGKGGKK